MESQQLILVVDDHEDNRLVFKSLLTHYSYAVLEAVNGQDGLNQATDHHPDLVLMDLSMPVMDGWEALRKMRENTKTADIPVVAVTAHDSDGRNWRKAGFSAYLRKPCLPGQLLDTIREFLPPPSEDP